MTEKVEISLYDGKYTYVREEGKGQHALRYGKPWRELTGDGFILAMAQEIEELREQLDKFKGFRPFSKVMMFPNYACDIPFNTMPITVVTDIRGIVLPSGEIFIPSEEDGVKYTNAINDFYQEHKSELSKFIQAYI